MTRTQGSTISGLGVYRPGRKVTNAAVSELTPASPEWIEQRTGILTRYRASAEEDVLTMSVEAGAKALADASVDVTEVDLVILATATRRQRLPGAGPQIASRLGIPDAGAFDVNAVCAGFCYSLALASNAVRLGEARNVLVVGAERTSDFLDPNTPDSYVIFGDGAGAAVVTSSETPDIGPVAWGSDGARHGVLEIREDAGGREYVTMDGPLVYKWSTTTMPKVARRACELAGVSMSEVKWFVPHQANRRIVDTLARVLEFPADRVARDVVDTGNTSSASVPLALSRLCDSGRARPGDLALVLGFGAGLTYAGQIIRIP
ncbi:3-oxoacyl-ACP synthase [Amycolatopsis sp. WAC 04169]|uniref:beta-ketoacyl-ACP synthase III n=1 Tax=Amycolatopsis sp. WAC 04169 TaxID=2203197 RepID=UPI000F7B5440|nr:beta-ketoacyl-ACP synthase III [Amycolatopsis sp. WAC 04169]RSN29159.1 3-oxoacyl-ACP synthase [Amycolatopsis sp. WAC 04169]